MTYPFFDSCPNMDDWSGADTLQWCQNNIGTDCSAEFTVMLSEFGHNRPIYVDGSGNVGVPLDDNCFAHVLFFNDDKPFTRFFFRSAKCAVLAKTSIG